MMQFSTLIFYILCFTCIQVSLSATDNAKLIKSGQSHKLRIIHGSPAASNQFPYVVLISYNRRPACTGSIIHKNWILTAAHCCFIGQLHEASVAVGTNYLGNGTTYRVKGFIVHSEFDHIPEEENDGVEYVINDICLIHVERSIEFNKNVSPISLPLQEVSYNYEENAIMVGWGSTKIFGVKPRILQYAMVQLLSTDQCKKDWPYITDDTHLCTSTSEKKSVCYGDSGGPVVYEGVQVALISTGETYCTFNKSNLHTKVANYIEWIKYQLSMSNDSI